MSLLQTDNRILLMGASGRVNRLLLTHWRKPSNPAPHVLTQSRKAGFDLTWSPLEDGPTPLQSFAKSNGPLRAIVAMIGATPSTAGDMSDAAPLAQAVIRAAELAGIGRVLLASSSAVYALGENLTEHAAVAPSNAYGRAKLEMEQAVARMDTSVEVCCLRIGNVAGADALLGRLRDAATDPIKLDRFADGKGPLRSYISPARLAACLEQLAAYQGVLPAVLNCASQAPVEMADLLEAAQAPWEWSPAPAGRLGTQRVTLDSHLLGEIIGKSFLEATPKSMIADLRD